MRLEEREKVVVEIDLDALRNAGGDDASQPQQQGRREPSPRELRANRAVMTVLHFLITYPKYSFSLFLLFASLTTPLPTATEQVSHPFAFLREVVSQEAQLYHECVRQSFGLQDVIMDRAVSSEQVRVNGQRVVTQQLIQDAAVTTQNCYNATLGGQRSMQGWEALGLIVPKTFNGTSDTALCSSKDQERLYSMLSEDLTNALTNVNSILDDYIAQSLASLRKILAYSQERGAYDYDYFIGVKIQATLDLLDFAAPSIFLALPEQRLIFELRGILQGLLFVLNGAYVRIDLLMIRIAEFEVSIQAFYLNYVDLFGLFGLITAFVRDLLPAGFPLPTYFDISGLPLPSALLPPIFQIPIFDGVLPNIEDLVSEYIIKALTLIARLLQEAAEEASEQTRKAIEEIIEMLRDLLTLEDYDPPKYPKSDGIGSPEDEVVFVNDLAETTKTDAYEALDDILKHSQNVPDYEPTPPDLGEIGPPDVGEEYTPTEFSLLDLSAPEITIPVWLLSIIGYICSRTFIIECVTQTIRLYRLKQKHEKNGKPDLPEIDYLVGTDHDDTDEQKAAQPSKLAVAQKMLLRNLMNPFLILGFVTLPFVMSVLIFWFPHVKDTCIDSRRGTFLARNFFTPVQVNKANTQGYVLRTAAQLKCHRRQRTTCSDKSAESDAAFRRDVATLYALQDRFNKSTEVLGILDRCVDTSTLDELFNVNCCGLDGYTPEGIECSLDQQPQYCPIDTNTAPPSSFRPVGEYLLKAACQAPVNTLSVESALFNCTVVEESCNDVPCDGVDADLIKEMTIEADCSAEIYLIQLCMFIAFAVYHAIMINVCNALLFNGILHLRWRSLNPEGIKIMTHVKADGEFVKGGDIQERTDRVKEAMKQFRLAGWVQIGLGVVVFLFWMITFVILRKTASRFDMYHA